MELLKPEIVLLALLVASTLFPQLRAFLPLLQRKADTAPTVPAPQPDPQPAPLSLVDASVSVLLGLARKKFPWMPTPQAIQRLAAEAVEQHDQAEAKRAEVAVKGPLPAA